MINAGRVAIVPKGDWTATTQYGRLDLVTYDNKMYIGRVDNIPVGTLPTDSDYFQLCLEFSLTLDSELSDTSDNPVKNRGIKKYIDDIVAGVNTLITGLTNSLSSKVDKVSGKDLSTNDFTTAYKDKIGTATLTTTNKNLSGAVNELNSSCLKLRGSWSKKITDNNVFVLSSGIAVKSGDIVITYDDNLGNTNASWYYYNNSGTYYVSGSDCNGRTIRITVLNTTV